jgi:thiol-disulfide isomerase/thioredoxin
MLQPYYPQEPFMWIRSLILFALLAAPVMADQTVHLTVVPTGTADRLGGSYYMNLILSDTKPPAIKKLPDDLSNHVMYGMMKFHSPGGTEIAVVIDSPDGKPSRMFVDSNGNGDLTDDAAPEWVTGPEYKGKLPGLRPQDLANVGGAMIKMGSAGKSVDVHIGMWRYDADHLKGQTPEKLDERRHELKYYRDYSATGKITLDGKEHDAFLLDELVTGSFAPTGDGAMVRLFIDRNDNGTLDKDEMFDAAKPMKIDGHVYELKDIDPDGSSFTFASSTKTSFGPDDVKVGQIVPTFSAIDQDGHAVNFPQDYKGKLVMLDFWATWCAPCMAEVPNVVANYDKYHDHGFEVLGVTLDQAADGDKVKQVTKAHKMVWPQLFADPGKSHAIADMYSVNAIPSAFLVDGTTGKILVVGNDLRGDGLQSALEKFSPSKASHTESR